MQKLRFHHVGFPSDRAPAGAARSASLKRCDWGYFDNPYGVEWHHFDADNELPPLIRAQPHIAFVVDDLQEAIAGKQVVLAPTSPAAGVSVAFIFDRGVLVELMQFDRPEAQVWPHPGKFQI